MAAALLLPTQLLAQYTLVSVGLDGQPANAYSGFPSVSADGRYVTFVSYGTNLVANDTNGLDDVFVRDLQTNTTVRVNVTSGGAQSSGQFAHINGTPQISGNGRYVVFATQAVLAPEDTNDCYSVSCNDIYVHDLQTHQTTLVSVATDGTVGNNDSREPQISDDGRYVVFTSTATNLVPNDTNGTTDIFLRDRVAGTTTRVNVGLGGRVPERNDGYASGPHISGDGNVITYFMLASASAQYNDCLRADLKPNCAATAVLDRGTGQTGLVHPGMFPLVYQMSTDGRYLAMYDTSSLTQPSVSYQVYDRTTATSLPMGDSDLVAPITMSANAHLVVLNQRASIAMKMMLFDSSRIRPVDLLGGANLFATNPALAGNGSLLAFQSPSVTESSLSVTGMYEIYATKLDADGDGMIDAWERDFGLNPADPSDATADPDGDGRTNLQEYQADTNPVGKLTKYLAEGSANSVFATYLAILNPNDTAAGVTVQLPRIPGLDFMTLTRRIPPHTRITIDPRAEFQGKEYFDFSTMVESDLPVVVDRTLGFTYASSLGHGKTAETAVNQPATTWYFAEGATSPSFSLFYLFLNPGDATANVTVDYLLPAPQAPITKTYVVPPHSRYTIIVNREDPKLAWNDISAKVSSDQPIVAERTLYFASLGQTLGAAAGGAGVTAPAVQWFLAEGATGSFFDMFVLLANAETTDANVTLTYLLPDGSHFDKTYLVAKHSRLTIWVDQEDPRLINTPVSVIANSTNAVPIIAERTMWWPEGQWYEGHLAAGATVTSKKWGLADGQLDDDEETYILVANTSSTAGTAVVTLMFEDGTTLARAVALPANSRTNVRVASEFPEAMHKKFGAVVQSDGVNLVVERSMYSSEQNIVWSGGTSALGTPIP